MVGIYFIVSVIGIVIVWVCGIMVWRGVIGYFEKLGIINCLWFVWVIIVCCMVEYCILFLVVILEL